MDGYAMGFVTVCGSTYQIQFGNIKTHLLLQITSRYGNIRTKYYTRYNNMMIIRLLIHQATNNSQTRLSEHNSHLFSSVSRWSIECRQSCIETSLTVAVILIHYIIVSHKTICVSRWSIECRQSYIETSLTVAVILIHHIIVSHKTICVSRWSTVILIHCLLERYIQQYVW